MRIEHNEIKRNERGGVQTDQFIDFQLECFRTSKNILFYSTFGRNRLIETINGYDDTVHDGPFQKYRGRWISIDGLDALWWNAL